MGITGVLGWRKETEGVPPMKRRAFWGLAALLVLIALLTPSASRASDHADPLNLTDPNANITGLFIFPKDDQYVLIFNMRKSLTNAKPYNLGAYEYVINIDLTTPVTFDSDEDRARYGGTIPVPDKLHPDVTIKVRLNDDTTLKSIDYTGLKNTDKIRTFTGVRDDPFIFPRFFKKNVISMVMSIPRSTGFHPVGRDLRQWQIVRPRWPLDPQPVAALSVAEFLRSEGSGARTDQGQGLPRQGC